MLLPTWFNGVAQGWLPYLGSAGYVDTTVYAAIAVDAFGAGRSSSPSDPAWQRRPFPVVTIRDMVNAQRELLRRHLGIETVHAVVGISMGGMQAFEWAVAYPSDVTRIVSIEGSPRLTSYDLVFWSAMQRTIASVRELGVPRDSALRQLARLFILGASTPTAVTGDRGTV